MITRKRARERISLPAINKFIYGAPAFADKIAQALITNTKFSDDIPEQPEFNQFVSTNLVGRAITYPLVHLGDRWGIYTEIPTAWSYVSTAVLGVGAGLTLPIITHSSLGEFYRAKFETGYYNFEIIIKVDGYEVYRITPTALNNYDESDYQDEFMRILQNTGDYSGFIFEVKHKFKFRNLFQILIHDLGGGSVFLNIQSVAAMHQINW